MSSGVATPSASTNSASFTIGIRIRLTTKPGPFLTVMGVLPNTAAMACTAAWVASLVCRPRIISTNAISGTGLKKCMPMQRSGRWVTAASLVMEIDEVLDAISTSGASRASNCCTILTLSA